MINRPKSPESYNRPELDKLPNMLEEIGYEGTQQDYDMSAYDWSFYGNTEIKKILQKIFDQEIEFSEENEAEIVTTLEELILNSSSACNEDESLKIQLTAYFGKKGLVIHLRDEGPGFDCRKALEVSRQNTKRLTREQVLYHRNETNYPGGSGMFCLLNFSQNFQFNEKGNQIIVEFRYRHD